MPSFGFITEGKTDKIVIENILSGYFDSLNIDFRPFLPLLDETDKNNVENFSNWKLVLDYCQSPKFKQALQFVDYLIVQIDTDVCEERHYDISKLNAGVELTPEELIEKVSEKLQSLIGNAFFDMYSDQIIFAISVHEIECWLLPIYYTDNRKTKIKGCLDTLNQKLNIVEKFRILADDKNPDHYDKISRKYLKHKFLMSKYKDNPSLKIFIEEIEKRNIQFEE
jgi:hypothetical protein